MTNYDYSQAINTPKQDLLFAIFSVWSFVLLGRPQDIFLWLSAGRPALVLGIIVILCFILQHHKYRANKLSSDMQAKLFFSFVAIMVLGVPFAYYRKLAFTYVVTVYSNAIVYFVMTYKVIDSITKVKKIILICCFSTFLYSIFAVSRGELVGNRLSFGSNFDPNDLAFFLVLFMPFNFLYLSKNNSFYIRTFCFFNIPLTSLTILMTGSRGGFISLLVSVFLLTSFKTNAISNKTKSLFVLICCCFCVIFANSIDLSRFSTLSEVGSDYNIYDETGRLAIWKTGIKLMLLNPLTGVGVGCFNEAIGSDRAGRGLQEIWQAPHNSLVQVGTETGILGLLLFLVLNLNTYRIFSQCKRLSTSVDLVKIVEMAEVGYIGMFMGAMFLSQAYSIYFIFYIVLSSVLSRLSKDCIKC